MAGRLTVVGIKALSKPGRYSDGDGLYLHIRPPDRRSWLFRYTRHGKTRDMGLGAFPDVSLAGARKAAGSARGQLRDGLDPVAVKIAAKPVHSDRTFRVVAAEHIEAHKGSWRNPKHAAQWAATLTTYAYPFIGDTLVRDVSVNDVLKVLRPIWSETPETASRVRGRIEAVLDGAKARGWRAGENPARWKGNLSGLLPPKGRVAQVEHQPSLPWEQMPAFMAALRQQDGIAARALELVILTAARTGEVRGSIWSEVDLDEAIWMVPAERMKGKRLHRVPLSDPAVSLLRRQLKLRADGADLIFPGAKAEKPLSDMALSALVRRMNGDTNPPRWRDISKRAIVPHGFRSSFRVWAGEQTTVPREVVEAALAHTLKDKVEAAYARTDLLERRRPLMVEWAKWCGGGSPPARTVISGGAAAPEE